MKRLLPFFLTFIMIIILCVAPMKTYAFDVFGNACGTGGATSAVCQEKGNSKSNPLVGPNGLLITLANIIALVAGTVAVIVVILAGLRYITSNGDPSKTQAAKSALMYAIIGLVIIAAADTIIGFVLSKL